MTKLFQIITAVIIILFLMTPLIVNATVDCSRCDRCETNCPRMQFAKLTYRNECDGYSFLNFVFITGLVVLAGIPVIIVLLVIRITRKLVIKTKLKP